MKKTFFALILAIGLAWSSTSSASLIVEYDGLAGASQAANNGTGATGFDLTRGAGIVAASGTNFNSTNFTITTALGDAIVSNDYLSFGFNVNAGSTLDMTDILVELDRSNTGPDMVHLLFDANGDGFDTGDVLQAIGVPTTGAILTFNSGLPIGLNSTNGAVEFRFYFTGATSSVGTSDIEDDLIGGASGNVGLQLNGNFSVVPEPASGLVLAGLAGLLMARRRIS